MDRQTFLDRLAAERARWEKLLGSLTEEQALAPAAIGAWSVREALIHLAFRSHRVVAHLAAIREGRASIRSDPSARDCPVALDAGGD